jgi:hypothetical protein
MYETTETTMTAAHQSGMAYWCRNKPGDAARADLELLARSCGSTRHDLRFDQTNIKRRKSLCRYTDSLEQSVAKRPSNSRFRRFAKSRYAILVLLVGQSSRLAV